MMPLHLMNISDAPDSWRRRRTLESVSFAEASQLRSFIIFRPDRLRDGAPESYETEPPSPARRSRTSGFFEAEMGIRVLRGGDGYPSRRSRKHIVRRVVKRRRASSISVKSSFASVQGSCPLCYGASARFETEHRVGRSLYETLLQAFRWRSTWVVNRINSSVLAAIRACMIQGGGAEVAIQKLPQPCEA